MDSANQEDEETPVATWTAVKNRRLNGKTHVETPQLTLQQLQLPRIRHEMCDLVHQPPAKRGMSSIVFATANITSADPRQSTADRTVGLNCTGCMAELEA